VVARPVARIDASMHQSLQEQFFFAASEPADCRVVGGVARITLREGHLACRKKDSDAVAARATVDIFPVVVRSEGSERLGAHGDASATKFIKQLLPRRLVKEGGVGDDTIEIEANRIEALT
jgi:hypothetical protein